MVIYKQQEVYMKLNIKEIKYIRQSLEYRASYYKGKSRYKEYLDDVNKLIKKFIKLEGDQYVDIKKFNDQTSKAVKDKLNN